MTAEAAVCVCVLVHVCTNLLPGACDSDTILDGDLSCSVSTRSGVFSEAEVIIRAQVNHILHYPTCVPERERDHQTEETIDGRRQVVFASSSVHLTIMTGTAIKNKKQHRSPICFSNLSDLEWHPPYWLMQLSSLLLSLALHVLWFCSLFSLSQCGMSDFTHLTAPLLNTSTAAVLHAPARRIFRRRIHCEIGITMKSYA